MTFSSTLENRLLYRITSKIKPYRHTFFLIGILVMVFSPHLIKILGFNTGFSISMTILMLSSVSMYYSIKQTRSLEVPIMLIMLGVIWVYDLEFMPNEYGIGMLFILILYFGYMTYLLFRDLINQDVITVDGLSGALAGYLMLGVLGFFAFTALIIAYPETSFTQNYDYENDMDSLLYFSFVTLTTIGYGDIVPASALSQKVAVLLGVIGQFYVAVVIAIIVGRFMQDRNKRHEE